MLDDLRFGRFPPPGNRVRVLVDIPENPWTSRIDDARVDAVIRALILGAAAGKGPDAAVHVSATNHSAGIVDDGSGRLKGGVRITLGLAGPQASPWDPGPLLALGITPRLTRNEEGIEFLSLDLPLPEAHALPPLPLPVGRDAPLRFLVMDEVPDIVTLVVRFLQMGGNLADGCHDDPTAADLWMRARAAGLPYDVVIADLNVGYRKAAVELLATLRPVDSRVRVVVFSGYSPEPMIDRWFEYGFAAALRKPCSVRDLDASVRLALRHEAQAS
jgi:CheY-like chemotaxis protein